MKLSEAIRIGAHLHEQTICELAKDGADGKPRTCALGAAFVAVTGLLPYDDMRQRYGDDPRLEELWDKELGKAAIEEVVQETLMTRCEIAPYTEIAMPPEEGSEEEDPDTMSWDLVVIELNDGLKWTRERIADYLAGKGL